MNEQNNEERGMRNEEGLQALGRKTDYRMDYAPEVLETFENKHPDNDYWVQFNCPEFTSLCPITGQPGTKYAPVAASPSIPTPTTASPARNMPISPSAA